MTYSVKFTETTNPAKPSITVEDQTINNTTSLKFVGKNYAGYGEIIAENFLHLLENFARGTPPGDELTEGTPVQGQLWYDNSPGVNILKVYDGTEWNPTGSIKKSATAPLIDINTPGDLWIDTDKNQLYLSSGANWLLIGPQFSAGVKTGPEVETIIDTENNDRFVTTIFSEDNRIAIISKTAFTPKTTIPGFPTINQGVNLSSIDATNVTSPTKFWGRSSEADALHIRGNTVASTNFLRSDVLSTTNMPFEIRNNSGLTIGSDLRFNISSNDTATTFYSKASNKGINFKVNVQGDDRLNDGEYVALAIAGNARVGLGPNNLSPVATLDVAGDVRTDGAIKIDDLTEPNNVGDECSLSTQGGLSVNKKSYFGSQVVVFDTINFNKFENDAPQVSAIALQPGTAAANEAYDIGSSARKFRNVYAKNFVGNVTGNVIGNVTGSFTGSATSLASQTTFRLAGEVVSNNIIFDGATPQSGSPPNTQIFTTTVSQDIITQKEEIFTSYDDDYFLIYRGGNIGSGLKKITKTTMLSNIATVPIGALFPYAGGVLPAGYLLCDGSEVKISKYQALFQVIGYTYKPSSNLQGQASFALPDLRGKFALGRDNMDNGLVIPDKNSPTVNIDAGGGPANNVTSVVADTIGASSGSEAVTLAVNNLPDHNHNLSSATAQYYAVGVSGVSDSSAIPNRGLPSGLVDGYGLPNSGSVISGTLGQPLNTMNPYLTINYIIYTGVIE